MRFCRAPRSFKGSRCELPSNVVEVSVAEVAIVRWRFDGKQRHPASGKRVSITGMNVLRIAGQRIAELWVNADDLGELEQLGIVNVAAAR